MKFVTSTYRAWRRETSKLDERLKSAVIKSILDANGWNDYELPHGYVEWKPTVQDNEPLARALTFEDAEGVLPCSQAHSPTIKKFKSSRARVFLAMCNTVSLHRHM